jgi:hypothetical protein
MLRIVRRVRDVYSERTKSAPKHNPRHVLTLDIFSNDICCKCISTEFCKAKIQIQDWQKEYGGDENVEQMSERGIVGGYADEDASQRIRDQET